MEDMPRERSPYYVMNTALREKNRLAVKPWRDYVWLLLHALRKLPPSGARVVYRGMTGSVLVDGAELQWSAFSSMATKVDVMEIFLDSENAPGPHTMIHLELTECIGREISAFSLHPQECEVLLPPNVCFEVVSQYNSSGGLVMVQCKQTESLDSLLEFGHNKDAPLEQPDEVPLGVPADADEGLQAEMARLQVEAQRERDASQLIELGAKTRAQAITLLDEYGSLESATNALLFDVNASISSKVRKLVHNTRNGWEPLRDLRDFTCMSEDNKVAIRNAGGIDPLVALVQDGAELQKKWATKVLINLATNAGNKVAIAKAGGVAPLVELARRGKERQKTYAAWALCNLADNATNKVAIAAAGGIAPLVALARNGTDCWVWQKTVAVQALLILAENADNQVAIAEVGGIAPLVTLISGGTEMQIGYAAAALALLARNADNQVAIAEAGGIAPLVALAGGGSDGQKKDAAEALTNLACSADNKVAIRKAGGIAPLVALAHDGTDGQQIWAAAALRHLGCGAVLDSPRATPVK